MNAAPDHFIHPWRSTGIAFFVGLTLVAMTLATVMLWAGYNSFRRELSGYSNVSLNESMDEVWYRLGPPPAVLKPRELPAVTPESCRRASGRLPLQCLGVNEVYDFLNTDRSIDPATSPNAFPPIPADKEINDFRQWMYGVSFTASGISFTGREVDVHFDKDGLVESVSCTGNMCPLLVGIGKGTSEEDLVKTLGEPSQSTIYQGTKSVHYDELGLDFSLEKGSVVSFSLTRRKGGDLALLRRFIGRVGRRLL